MIPTKPYTSDHVWHSQERIARNLTWVAAIISTIVALAGPTGYWLLSVQSETRASIVTARLHAAFLNQSINSSKGDWRQSVAGLITAELSETTLPERRSIVDAKGQEVDGSGHPVDAPSLQESAQLVSSTGEVGRVLIVRSLRPVLLQTALTALISLSLGAAIFLTLRLLPLRALRRTLTALRQQEAQARVQAEDQLRVILDHSIEGVIAYLPHGEVISANQAALRMLGYADEDIRRLNVTTILECPHATNTGFGLPLGRLETVARRRDGTVFPVEVGSSEVMVGGESQRIAIVRDLSERKQNEARLSHMANYDDLTGLPNRSLFREQLGQAMARARRTRRPCALMFIDLDRFKHINDSLGHHVGDQLLVAVSKVLSACVRENDLLAFRRDAAPSQAVFRLGGDEFTILLEDLASETHAMRVAERIRMATAQPFLLGHHEMHISASVGITTFDGGDDTTLDDLIKQADLAMYRAKDLGRDTYCFFDEELNQNAMQRHQLEGQMHRALERNEFLLHYQPKLDVNTGEVIGVEALLRWQPTDGPLVGPDAFIPILEESGLIVPIGAWALYTGCAQMVAWQKKGMRPINLAVNLSARQFRQKDLIQYIASVLEKTGFEPTLLELELTESMLIEDSDAVLRILRDLGAMGVKIAIDDFGTGHSSLSYLKRFGVDTLKIDRIFVRDTPGDPEDCAIARAVIALGHGLNLQVVAEGVETQAQLDFLRQQGCDLVQGYLISRPLDTAAFEHWMGLHDASQFADRTLRDSPVTLFSPLMLLFR